MTEALVLHIARQALWTGALVAGPLLVLSVAVGLAVSVIQATTQINEQTLTFVPKMVAVAVAALVLGPWMLAVLTDFTRSLIQAIPGWIS
jgi:flagellar biosynthetic protein FliQ